MTTTPVPTEALGMDVLKTTDRCDRCGAQAYVATSHGDAELLWCAHHFGENDAALAQFVIVDERERLATSAPTSS